MSEAKALKALIADYGVSFDAATIMNALLRAGIAEDFQYASTTGSGAMKSFRKLTAQGEAFGINRPTMHPLKTEPRFYAEAFPRLLDLVVQQLRKEVDGLKL
ncbi:hypothetical protein [Stutzerimonas zhaodongensis]|jgi:hypothetical protein|uniref:hypothetical protein n=1 Tax=Stutzerimonas zhaodongensis TaxID=1176257 RepID=UPI001F4DE36F|nr:hypothetical protein [Stutzerimonas zhaodongensis]UNG17530.1 hypothetical protein MKP10_17165 [Stutzerimonas zhaodongensis]